jgi:hypothetical protein
MILLERKSKKAFPAHAREFSRPRSNRTMKERIDDDGTQGDEGKPNVPPVLCARQKMQDAKAHKRNVTELACKRRRKVNKHAKWVISRNGNNQE